MVDRRVRAPAFRRVALPTLLACLTLLSVVGQAGAQYVYVNDGTPETAPQMGSTEIPAMHRWRDPPMWREPPLMAMPMLYGVYSPPATGDSWLTPCQPLDQLPESPPRVRWLDPIALHVLIRDNLRPEMEPPMGLAMDGLLTETAQTAMLSPWDAMPMDFSMHFEVMPFKPMPPFAPWMDSIPPMPPRIPMAPPQGTCGDVGGGNVAPWPVAHVTVLDACDRTVRFDGFSSTDVDGLVVSWSWTFGDDSGADGAVVEHMYEAPGTYRIGLHVSDDAGASSYASGFVVVPPCVPPVQPSPFGAGRSFGDGRVGPYGDSP